MPSHCMHDCACACKSPENSLQDLLDKMKLLEKTIEEIKKENEKITEENEIMKKVIKIIK